MKSKVQIGLDGMIIRQGSKQATFLPQVCGFTANVAFRIISNKINPKRVVVIGPSHKFGFDGATISLHDEYETPLENIAIDKEYANSLIQQFDFVNFYKMYIKNTPQRHKCLL
jgi:predicted class III extradiol MEMO1 family dioxygenase